MPIFPSKTPEFVKALFPQFIWHMPDDDNNIYLTFDDGPTPEVTDWVLECLRAYHAKATFFCIGNNIVKHPVLFQQLITDGHAIGNHSHNHLKGWNTEITEYIEDVETAQRHIEKSLSTSLFRPPYGKFRIQQARALINLGYKIVLWDVLSYDWSKNVSKQKCLNNVVSKAENGSIVVMHDSKKAEHNLKYMLPRVLEHFSNLGYVFKGLPVTGIPE